MKRVTGSRRTLEEGLGQLTVTRHRVVAGGHQHLYADVVGAGFQVGGEAGGDGLRGAVEDEGVDECVAATVGDVGWSEAVAKQVVDVVTQAKVGAGDEVAADGTGVVDVGADDDLVLGREQGAGAEEVAGVTGVVGNDEIGGCLASIRSYDFAIDAASLVHMFTIAVAMTIMLVA